MTSDYKPTAGKLHGRPVPARSFVVVWRGNEPKVEPSHWAPDYTPAHQETEQLAIAHAMHEHIKVVQEVKQKWLKLNVLAAEVVAEHQEREVDFITVTKTPDLNEQLVMPEMENAPRLDQPTEILSDEDQPVDHGGWEDH